MSAEKKKELQVAAIENGTVIDHIPPARLFKVASLLGLEKMEGNTITGSDQLIDLLGYYSAGETVTLTIQRGNGTQYEEINVDVTLSSAQEAGAVETE